MKSNFIQLVRFEYKKKQGLLGNKKSFNFNTKDNYINKKTVNVDTSENRLGNWSEQPQFTKALLSLFGTNTSVSDIKSSG